MKQSKKDENILFGEVLTQLSINLATNFSVKDHGLILQFWLLLGI